MSNLPTTGMGSGEAAAGLFGRLFAQHVAIPPSGNDLDLRRFPARGGVFAFATDDHRLLQLLSASSIRRAVARRLVPQSGGAEAASLLRGIVRHVWWQPGYSAFENDWMYLQIARQLLGSRYRESLAFAPVWCARIDMHALFPRWTVTDRLDASGAVHAGPFITRKRAAQLAADLEDLFDLCRYHDVLVRAPHGERCAYFDMGKCPAPCDGSISLDFYRDMLAASVRFAIGDGAEFAARIQQQMATAATALAYEQAQRLKETASLARQALTRAGRFAHTPGALSYLIVQRGARRSLVRPFLCAGGVLESTGDVALVDIAVRAPTWLARLRSSDKSRPVDALYRTDSTALVCHYLGKGAKASGVYLNVHDALDGEGVARCVQSCFSRA